MDSQPLPDPRDHRHERERLSAALSTLGLHLPHETLERCLEYWDFLKDAGSRLNLVSRDDLERGPGRHVADALAALAAWFPPGPHRLLDVGSGGGLPGIPLALAHAGIQATLLEPRQKRSDWLSRVARGLDLQERIQVRTGRLEDQAAEWVHQFDVLTARAVASFPRVLEWALPRLGSKARLLVWHSNEQLPLLQQCIRQYIPSNVFRIEHTITYHFAHYDFSSNISAIVQLD